MISLGTVKKKHRKGTGRRVKSRDDFSVRKILEEEMVAFLDTEYLTSQVKGGSPAKLVSIGLVICRKDFKEVDRFHSYIYTEDELHDVFRELTGITEETLKNAPDYELVMEEVEERLAVWNVTRIFVWGPDQIVIQRDLLEHRKEISKRTKKAVNRILRMMKDLEAIYSKKLKMHSIGIANLKFLCGLGTDVSHDALEDAVDLKNVIKHIDIKGCPTHMVQAMKYYLADKETYCRYRRFHEKWENVPDGLIKKGQQMLTELEKVDSMEARALKDDIRVICTGEDTTFPLLEEYIESQCNTIFPNLPVG